MIVNYEEAKQDRDEEALRKTIGYLLESLDSLNRLNSRLMDRVLKLEQKE